MGGGGGGFNDGLQGLGCEVVDVLEGCDIWCNEGTELEVSLDCD